MLQPSPRYLSLAAIGLIAGLENPLSCQPDEPVYPVDPYVHVDDPANDPLDPGSFTPVVSNSVAHARYGINLMRLDDPLPSDDEDAMRVALAELAQESGISPVDTLNYYAIAATEEEFAAFKAESEADARGADPERRLATAGRRLVTTQKQVDACIATQQEPNSNHDDGNRESYPHDNDDDDDRGSDENSAAMRCCQSLAFPAFLLQEWSRLDPEEAEALMADAAVDGFYSRFIAPTSEAGDAEPPDFRRQGIQAWLSVCDPAFIDMPETLDAFKDRHGDFSDGSWPIEFHPIAMAKFAGRRIYRKDGRKNGVSVAESVSADCTVRETEVVMARDDGAMQFITYDAEGERVPYGYFPTGLVDTDTVKYTPVSCMGCHYTLDTRRFAVQIPSFAALNLRLRRNRDGEPLWRDDSACLTADDVLVEHAEPPAE